MSLKISKGSEAVRKIMSKWNSPDIMVNPYRLHYKMRKDRFRFYFRHPLAPKAVRKEDHRLMKETPEYIRSK